MAPRPSGHFVNEVLTKAEEKLFITKPESSTRLLPVCVALKLSGFDVAIIAEIMRVIQSKVVVERFSIINNRYLTCGTGDIYDLTDCKTLTDTPAEPKRMALTFWI